MVTNKFGNFLVFSVNSTNFAKILKNLANFSKPHIWGERTKGGNTIAKVLWYTELFISMFVLVVCIQGATWVYSMGMCTDMDKHTSLV